MMDHTSPLIDAIDLKKLIQTPKAPVLVDCRFSLPEPESGALRYQKGHLPEAHYLNLDRDLSDKSISLAGRHPLPGPEQFTELMQSLGINSDTPVVAYDDGDLAMAGRFWWLARYYGHTQVQVLNGGFAAWQKSEGPVSPTPVTRPGGGHFEAKTQAHYRVFYDELVALGYNGLLVDSRDEPRFRGEAEPLDPVAGHIPGAINAVWRHCFGSDGLMKSPADLAAHFAWLLPNIDRAVVYCGSGVTATVNLLALAHLGHHKVPLFAGSWSEWCQRGGPVETGPAQIK